MADAQVLKRRIGSGKACTSCRRRKNRCDGNRPSCGSCQSRGIRCAYPSVSVDELSLDELKSLIDLKAQGTVDTVREEAHVQPRHCRSSTANSEREEGRAGLGALLRASTEILGRDSEGSPAQNFDVSCFNEGTIDDSVQNNAADNQTSPATSPSESQDSPAFFGESSTFAFVSKVQSNAVPRQGPVSRNKRRRLSGSQSPRTHSLDSGLTPRDVDNSYALPPRDLADSLVDSYFNHVHRLYPFVHEPTFRSQYERMWMHDGDHSETKATWFALLNLIFAHGYEFHNPIQGRSPSHSATQFLVKARNIAFAHIFKEGNLELLQALLLMCHYLQGTLELNECWSLSGLMIRTSISMGLHLNPSPSMTAVEREVRKRVWWGCFVIDRTLSMKFGRPPSIPAASAADVELPLPVDDQYIMNDSIIPRQPASCPSLTTFFIETIKLAHIIDSVLLKLYPSTGRPWNSTISQFQNNHDRFPEIFGHAVLLDGELLSWWNGIPHHLRDEPNSPDGSDFQRQRNVMYIRYLNLRLLLHRQSFLVFSRQDIEDKFQRHVAIASCNCCISAARETIKLIYAQYRRRLLNSLWYNLHYVFTAIGVLLTLQTMEGWKLEALGQTETDELLEMGMEFLKAASDTSTLAARYLILLERIQTRKSGRETPMPGPVSGQGHTTQLLSDNADPALLAADRTPLQRPDEAPFPFNSDFTDFDDLLFGTGLPRDLLSADWSIFESI